MPVWREAVHGRVEELGRRKCEVATEPPQAGIPLSLKVAKCLDQGNVIAPPKLDAMLGA